MTEQKKDSRICLYEYNDPITNKITKCQEGVRKNKGNPARASWGKENGYAVHCYTHRLDTDSNLTLINMCNCGKRAYCGIKNKPNTHCNDCFDSLDDKQGMIKRVDSRICKGKNEIPCTFGNNGGPARHNFGHKVDGKVVPTHCSNCKLPGMIPKSGSNTCWFPTCSKDQCQYGYPKDMIKISCSKHADKKGGMKDLIVPRCIDCKKKYDKDNKAGLSPKWPKGVSQKNIKYNGKRVRKRCKKHIDEYIIKMKTNQPEAKVEIVTGLCQCKQHQPNFNDRGLPAKYCKSCKKEGMINVNKQHCETEGCVVTPTFGDELNEPKHCKEHKEENEFRCVGRMCPMCPMGVQPCYGYKENKPSHCVKHGKPLGMSNVISPECEVENCLIQPTWGHNPGKWLRCAPHGKEAGMKFKRNRICTKCRLAEAVCGTLYSNNSIHCAGCKDCNDVFDRNPKCVEEKCRTPAKYSTGETNIPTKCEIHADETYYEVAPMVCSSCSLTFAMSAENKLCTDCAGYINKTIRKEHILKKHIVGAGYVEDKKVKNFYHEQKFSHDRIPDGSCIKRRPDFLFDAGTHFVILEIDENQHKSYSPECEVTRMINIAQDTGGGLPVVFIRYNPDRYIDINGKITKKSIIKSKFQICLDSIKYHIDNMPNFPLSICKIYFDGYVPGEWPIPTYEISMRLEDLF